MGEIPETSLKRKREIDCKSAFADNDTSICNMFVFNLASSSLLDAWAPKSPISLLSLYLPALFSSVTDQRKPGRPNFPNLLLRKCMTTWPWVVKRKTGDRDHLCRCKPAFSLQPIIIYLQIYNQYII